MQRADGHSLAVKRTSLDAARLALAMLAATALLGALTSPAFAFSQRGHSFGFSFPPKGSEKGEGLGQLKSPAGIAVNESTHDIYVVDAGNQRVERFNASGEALEVWGYGVKTGAPEYQQCVKGETCKAGIAGTGASQFDYQAKLNGHDRAAIGIAVDNSPGSPSKGDVYVVSNTVSAQNVVEKFSPTGEPLGTLPLAALTVGGVAVDGEGIVWAQVSSEGGEGADARELALVHLDKVERFSNATTNTLLEPTVAMVEEPLFCPTAGIGIDRQGRTLYVNHERVSFEELCFPEQEEENKEKFKEEKEEGVPEPKKRKAVESSITAKLAVIGEPPESAEPLSFAALELDRLFTTAIAVDQTTGLPSSGNAYLDNVDSVAAFDASGSLIQKFGAEQLKNGGAGIAVDGATQDVYVADSKGNRVDVFEPEPAGEPLIDSLSYQNLEPTATELKALIDPRGKASEYFFEYGTEHCPSPACLKTEVKTVENTKPGFEGFGDVEVSEVVHGLAPATTYFFRVEAKNSNGSAACEERPPSEEPCRPVLHTFTTLPEAHEGLPDNRAWELVSPPDKGGSSIEAIGGIGGLAAPSVPAVQASEDGGAIAYGANAPVENSPEGNRSPESQEVISIRGGGAWSSKEIVTPFLRGEGFKANSPQEYQLFSQDLSLGALQPAGLSDNPLQLPPLLHELNGKPVTEEQRSLYLRKNLEAGCEAPPKSCYEPVVTPENVAPETTFGGKLHFLGGTPDLKHVVFGSEVPLLTGAKANDLYEWSAEKPAAEQLQLVDVSPGEVGVEEPGLGGAERRELRVNARNAISKDGGRVIFTARGGGTPGLHLFTRNMVTHNTLQVDRPEAGVKLSEGEAELPATYQAASSDGKQIIFTDTAPLTKTSTLQPKSTKEQAGEEAESPSDLYVCEVEEVGGEQSCKLTDLTAGTRAEIGEDADVAGEMPGASEDGSYVYFVANGALAPGAIKGSCETPHNQLPPPGAECNLYVSHKVGGVWQRPKLVAVLSDEDGPVWDKGTPFITFLSSRVSPNGLFLAFMSKRPLTGKDNEDVTSKAKGEVLDEEVFLYDAARETLTCTSCNPSGAKPHGVLDQQHAGEGEGLLAERAGVWRGQVLAGSLPTWAYTSSRQALYQPRYLSDQGRLFFNSPDQLVPLPAGEQYGFKMNVYQYEPSGLGSCANPAGCVSLISSGTSDRESAFLDASADGSSAFFITRSQLVSVDHDTALDLYNARVCSAQSPCIQSPAANPRPCETSETCRPSPTPPATFQTPLSASVSGSGNETKVINRSPETGKPKPKPCTSRACKLKAALKKCHKIKKRKKRQACERAARTRYGPKKAHHRRGKR